MQAEHTHTDHGAASVVISWLITALSWMITAEGHHALGAIAALVAIVYTVIKIYDRFKRRRHAKQIQP